MSDGLGDWGWGWLGQQVGGLPYNGKVKSYNPYAYWIMGEASGTTATDEIDSPNQDGTYTGVTLGQTGIGDGYNCPLWDGANDYLSIYTATLAGNWDGETGSILLWWKMSGSGVWTDSAIRYILRIETDNSNFLRLYKNNTNNQLVLAPKMGGTGSNIVKSSYSPTAWVNAIITWEYSSTSVHMYLDNVEVGTGVTIGQWAGALTSTKVRIGAYDTVPNYVHSGYLAHLAIFPDVLSSAARADLQVV